ncbi:Uncharacterized protein PBTT_04312 [Plasmodiophora brassicae]
MSFRRLFVLCALPSMLTLSITAMGYRSLWFEWLSKCTQVLPSRRRSQALRDAAMSLSAEIKPYVVGVGPEILKRDATGRTILEYLSTDREAYRDDVRLVISEAGLKTSRRRLLDVDCTGAMYVQTLVGRTPRHADAYMDVFESDPAQQIDILLHRDRLGRMCAHHVLEGPASDFDKACWMNMWILSQSMVMANTSLDLVDLSRRLDLPTTTDVLVALQATPRQTIRLLPSLGRLLNQAQRDLTELGRITLPHSKVDLLLHAALMRLELRPRGASASAVMTVIRYLSMVDSGRLLLVRSRPENWTPQERALNSGIALLPAIPVIAEATRLHNLHSNTIASPPRHMRALSAPATRNY